MTAPRLAAASACLLFAAATSSASPARERPAAWDSVVFSLKTWGAPIASWTVYADGSGAWVETVRVEGAAWSDYRLAYHDLAPDKRGAEGLGKILARLPAPAPNAVTCSNMMTDAPYGTLRITRGATTTEVAFNTGCMDDGYVRFVAVLKEADTLVAGRGKSAPIVRTAAPGE